MAVAQEERDAAVAQLASTRAELAAVTRRAAQAQAEADAARSAAAAQEATPRVRASSHVEIVCVMASRATRTHPSKCFLFCAYSLVSPSSRVVNVVLSTIRMRQQHLRGVTEIPECSLSARLTHIHKHTRR